MPINISVAEFKKNTSTKFGTRPRPLVWVDRYLAKYHEKVLNEVENCQEAYWHVRDIIRNINNWTEGLSIHWVNGEMRYQAYRDRNGYISELERQAIQTQFEIERFHTDLHADLELRFGQRDSITKGPTAPPKPILPYGRAESHIDLFGATGDNDNMPMEDMGPVHYVLLENEAYDTASVMLSSITLQNITPLQVRDSARVPKTVCGGVLTMGSLFAAMNSILKDTDKYIYHERHCTQRDYFISVLRQSSPQSPVMFAASDNNAWYSKAVFCRGLCPEWDGNLQWLKFDIIDTSVGIGVAKATMDERGNMTVKSHGEIAHYVAAPSLGFIKLKISS